MHVATWQRQLASKFSYDSISNIPGKGENSGPNIGGQIHYGTSKRKAGSPTVLIVLHCSFFIFGEVIKIEVRQQMPLSYGTLTAVGKETG